MAELTTNPVIIAYRGDVRSDISPHSQVLYANTYTNESTELHLKAKNKDLSNLQSPKFTFFTPLLPTNEIWQLGYKYYTGHRWNLIPAKKYGNDIFEIENDDSKQVLMVRGPDYSIGERQIVFTEDRYPSEKKDPGTLWRICTPNNERFDI